MDYMKVEWVVGLVKGFFNSVIAIVFLVLVTSIKFVPH